MLSLFLTETAVGSLVVLLLVPPRAAGRRFFRFTVGQTGALIVLGALLAASGAARTPLRTGLFGAAATLLLISAGLFHLGRLGPGLALSAAALPPGVAGVIADAVALVPPGDASFHSQVLHSLDALTSGLTTGSALIAMILGHHYLSIPGLSTDHLKRLALAFVVAIGARAAVIGVSLARHQAALAPLAGLLLDAGPAPMPRGGPDPFVLVFLLLHLLFGIVAAAVFAVMAWRTARIASTQSATGILYVGLIVVIVGELASRYLVALTGLPL